MSKLLGRECSERDGRRLIWRGRGWRIDVYPTGNTWAWHLCVSHARQIIVDKVSTAAHPSAAAAQRSVASVIRGLGRVVGLMLRADNGDG
jgi:hypothetical protein